ncbi:hypothetical protein RGF97_30940 [Streptomyces roseicoloratus]|uniref:DUF5709 domain-containing protein n=1 Tax=Streptomyces roseicoloratus TaxID=2508722 RepID=A0ABY9S4J8_9ACTN|nr:hypothetical protein [Streptomyces roseicoloratus]WMX48329.1 hypothetical protein RGF97_30940 [Streptomyces roseicoloratus]
MTAQNDPAAEQDARGDDVYQPTGSDAPNRPSGPLDPENMLGDETADSPEEPGFSPPDRPGAVTRRGTTTAEQREGAPLDDRLAEEEPDVTAVEGDAVGDLPGGEGEPLDRESGATPAGRLVAPDPRVPGGVTARDTGPEDEVPAEEAAMHRDTAVDGADGDAEGSP